MTNALRSSGEVVEWMLQQNIVLKSKMKDPETFASVQGFLLSNEMRESIGSILIKLVARESRKKRTALTVLDAFLTATIAAVLQKTGRSLSEDEMTKCANIIFAMLPMGRLEQSGLADQPLGRVARDRNMVGELQRIFGLH